MTNTDMTLETNTSTLGTTPVTVSPPGGYKDGAEGAAGLYSGRREGKGTIAMPATRPTHNPLSARQAPSHDPADIELASDHAWANTVSNTLQSPKHTQGNGHGPEKSTTSLDTTPNQCGLNAIPDPNPAPAPAAPTTFTSLNSDVLMLIADQLSPGINTAPTPHWENATPLRPGGGASYSSTRGWNSGGWSHGGQSAWSEWAVPDSVGGVSGRSDGASARNGMFSMSGGSIPVNTTASYPISVPGSPPQSQPAQGSISVWTGTGWATSPSHNASPPATLSPTSPHPRSPSMQSAERTVRGLRATCKAVRAAIPPRPIDVDIRDEWDGDVVARMGRWASAPQEVVSGIRRVRLSPSARGEYHVPSLTAQARFDLFLNILQRAADSLEVIQIMHNPFCPHDGFGLGQEREFTLHCGPVPSSNKSDPSGPSSSIVLPRVRTLDLSLKCRICSTHLTLLLASWCPELRHLKCSVVSPSPAQVALGPLVSLLTRTPLETLHLKVSDEWQLPAILSALKPCAGHIQELYIAPYDASRKVQVVAALPPPPPLPRGGAGRLAWHQTVNQGQAIMQPPQTSINDHQQGQSLTTHFIAESGVNNDTEPIPEDSGESLLAQLRHFSALRVLDFCMAPAVLDPTLQTDPDGDGWDTSWGQTGQVERSSSGSGSSRSGSGSGGSCSGTRQTPIDPMSDSASHTGDSSSALSPGNATGHSLTLSQDGQLRTESLSSAALDWIAGATAAAERLATACPRLERGWWWTQLVDLDYRQLKGYERWGWRVHRNTSSGVWQSVGRRRDGARARAVGGKVEELRRVNPNTQDIGGIPRQHRATTAWPHIKDQSEDVTVVMDPHARRLSPMVVRNQDCQGTEQTIASEEWH